MRTLTRVLLKISGEAFCALEESGVDPEVVQASAEEIVRAREAGAEIAVVVGGGNLIRGSTQDAARIDRVTADQMGMLATVVNALALRSSLERLDAKSTVLCAFGISGIVEPFESQKCDRLLREGQIVLLAGGTGQPFFTTDTAAALRALEINANVFLKATKVDGVYSADPAQDPGAVRYDRLTYMDVLTRRLRVMDATAVSLCMEHNLPIVVFSLRVPGNIARIVKGERMGTLIGGKNNEP